MDALKILVVDDESRMRKLVKDFLVKKGYEILEAENGEQAVEQNDHPKPDAQQRPHPDCPDRHHLLQYADYRDLRSEGVAYLVYAPVLRRYAEL